MGDLYALKRIMRIRQKMALLRTLTHYVKDKHHFRGNEQAYTNKQDFTEFKNLLETYGPHMGSKICLEASFE